MNEKEEFISSSDSRYILRPPYKGFLERFLYLIFGFLVILILFILLVFLIEKILMFAIDFFSLIYIVILLVIFFLILSIGSITYANIRTNHMFISLTNFSIEFYEGAPYKITLSMWKQITGNYWYNMIKLNKKTIFFNDIRELEIIEDSEGVYESYGMAFRKKKT